MQLLDRSLELDTALRAVARACNAAMAVRREIADAGAGTIVKDDKSPVTVADFAAQAVVAAALQHAFGDDPLVGEESSDSLRAVGEEGTRARVVEAVCEATGMSVDEGTVLDWLDRGRAVGDTRRYWVLDPVDGTKGFLRGGQFAVALALIEDGQPTVAVLGCPAYEASDLTRPGLLLAASRGLGAFEVPLHGFATAARRPLRVDRSKAASACRMCESVESGHTDQSASERIVRELGIHGDALRMDSQAKYAAVARGDADLYLRLPTRKGYQEKVWDHAAGVLVLQEAGGTITDVDGAPLDFRHGTTLAKNRGVIASACGEHAHIVEVVRRALG